MAHTCPTCGEVCYCGGDIDDCEFDGTDEQFNCTHCPDDLDDDGDNDFLGPEGCLYPGECCMPGPHYVGECHRPADLTPNPEGLRTRHLVEGTQHPLVGRSESKGE